MKHRRRRFNARRRACRTDGHVYGVLHVAMVDAGVVECLRCRQSFRTLSVFGAAFSAMGRFVNANMKTILAKTPIGARLYAAGMANGSITGREAAQRSGFRQ